MIECLKCQGAGWVRGYELEDSDDDTYNDRLTKYTFDICDGEGEVDEDIE